MQKNIAIIGNGVYGVALAYLFSSHHHVDLYGRTLKHPSEKLISDFPQGEHYDYVCISITTKHLPELLEILSPSFSTDSHIILAMKGLTGEGLLPYESTRKSLPNHRISVLSGPGFADEILQDIPIHLVLASDNFDEDEEEDFLIDHLTLDFSHDILGVSWCGVLKNVYAIGAGQRSRGSSFDRVHYTREVVHELSEILVYLGGDPETAHGPAGRGDIWICTTPHSRNFRLGAGEVNLIDQAEGYNGLLQFQKMFPEVFHPGKYPILLGIGDMLTQEVGFTV